MIFYFLGPSSKSKPRTCSNNIGNIVFSSKGWWHQVNKVLLKGLMKIKYVGNDLQ